MKKKKKHNFDTKMYIHVCILLLICPVGPAPIRSTIKEGETFSKTSRSIQTIYLERYTVQ